MSQQEDFVENYRRNLIQKRIDELTNNADLINNFISFSKEKGIHLTNENFDYIQTIGIVAKYSNLVSLLNTSIKKDKEELIALETLDREFEKRGFASGHYYSEKYIVMAHPYFRRGHYEGSNFAPRFLDVFFAYNKAGNEKFVSIDTDRVRINVDNSMYMEADTWYGAKFKNNIADIEDGIVKLRPPGGLGTFDIEFFFANTYSLDIKWTSKNGIKIFQAEEFKEHGNKIIKNNIEYYPVKYVHAEFDTAKGVFRHFDGAIHFYTEEEYYLRRDEDFNYNKKNALQLKTLSQKLFKINGQIDTADWVELVSHYLTGNPLIFEYFEGKLPDRLLDIVEKLKKREENDNI